MAICDEDNKSRVWYLDSKICSSRADRVNITAYLSFCAVRDWAIICAVYYCQRCSNRYPDRTWFVQNGIAGSISRRLGNRHLFTSRVTGRKTFWVFIEFYDEIKSSALTSWNMWDRRGYSQMSRLKLLRLGREVPLLHSEQTSESGPCSICCSLYHGE